MLLPDVDVLSVVFEPFLFFFDFDFLPEAPVVVSIVPELDELELSIVPELPERLRVPDISPL